MANLKKIISPTKKKTIVLLAAIIAVAGLLFFLEKKGITDFYTRTPKPSDVKTTSDARSAQADFNIEEVNNGQDDGGRQAGNTNREDQGSAGIEDTSGNIDHSVDTSSPIVSSTGEIALFSPRPNNTINNQVIVAGTSTLATVTYRIHDDISGLITMGSLKVIDGKFSGTLHIDTNGKSGQLDLYGTKSDGNEFSNIVVPLKFN